MIVAVKSVLGAKGDVGVKVATNPVAVYVTVPGTAVAPGPVSVKVAGVSVAEFIALLKFAWTADVSATPVAPCAGVVESTVGAVVSGILTVSLPHPSANRTNSAAKDDVIPNRILRIFCFPWRTPVNWCRTPSVFD